MFSALIGAGVGFIALGAIVTAAASFVLFLAGFVLLVLLGS